MTAGVFCTREVVICTPDDSVQEAARRMRDFHVGSIVVVQPRNGSRTPVGILTDRDIVVNLVAAGRSDFDEVPVSEVMSSDLVTAEENESLSELMKRMRASGIRRIPVVNRDGALEGLVAFDDLVELLAEETADLRAMMSRERKREGEELGVDAWRELH